MQKNRTKKKPTPNVRDAESKLEACSGIASGDTINGVSNADWFQSYRLCPSCHGPGWTSVTFLPAHAPPGDVLPVWLARAGPCGGVIPTRAGPDCTLLALQPLPWSHRSQSLLFQTVAVKRHVFSWQRGLLPPFLNSTLVCSCYRDWLLSLLPGTCCSVLLPLLRGLPVKHYCNTGKWARNKPGNIL